MEKGKMTKPLCSLKGCPSIANKSIELKPLIDQFISDIYKDNPKANPLCIKRIVSNLLSEEAARLFVELVERNKQKDPYAEKAIRRLFEDA